MYLRLIIIKYFKDFQNNNFAGNIIKINNFKITGGEYLSRSIENLRNIQEYEKETEYVCIIKK